MLASAALAGIVATPAYADSNDDMNCPRQIRVRALGVLPDSSGSTVDLAGARMPASLSIANSIVPEADVSYYFTPNWAVEVIAGVTPHDITGTGAISGLSVGRARLLPPTVTARYHFTDFGAFRPHVGAGVNYTVFFDQRLLTARRTGPLLRGCTSGTGSASHSRPDSITCSTRIGA